MVTTLLVDMLWHWIVLLVLQFFCCHFWNDSMQKQMLVNLINYQ